MVSRRASLVIILALFFIVLVAGLWSGLRHKRDENGVTVTPTTRLPAGTSTLRSSTIQPERQTEDPAFLPVRMPAEFERLDALLLGGSQLVELHPSVLVDIVSAIHRKARILCLTGTSEDNDGIQKLLLGEGLPAGSVVFLNLPVLTMWVRDFGPICVENSRAELVLVDTHYRERRGNKIDDTVPESMATLLELPCREVPLTMEGGDLLSNGRGLCLSSTRLINRNAHYRNYDPETVGSLLREYLGFEEWIPLPPLEGESTGHVDMFLTLVKPDVVVVGQYDPALDPINAERLDQIASQLAQTETNLGRLSVERIPMPPHDDGLWRTYTNVIFANGTLLIPAYPDVCPDLDRQAREIYSRLLPDWQVIGIDVSELIKMRGALRCITMNIPHVKNSGLRLP